MLRKHLNILMAPADALGSGGAAVADDVPPNSVGDFMNSLGSLEEPAKKPEDKPNGDTNAKPGGDPNATTGAAGGDKAVAANTGPATGSPDGGNKGPFDQNSNKPATSASSTDKTATTDDDRWPRSSSDWDTFKTRRQQEREKAKTEIASRDATIADLQGRVKTFEETAAQGSKENPEAKAEIDRLTQTVTELGEQIRELDVTRHPKWKAYFGEREKEQIDLATDILGAEKGKKFADLVAIPDIPALTDYKKAAMQEFITDLTTFEQSSIANVTNSLMLLNRQKANEIKKNDEHVSQLRANRDTEVKQIGAAKEKLFAGTLTELSDPKTGIAMFQKQEGKAEWNQQVDAAVNQARRLFFGAKDLKAAELAKAAMHAAAFPVLLDGWQKDMAEKDKEIATLQAQVKAMTAALPGGTRDGAGGSGGEGGGGNRKRVESSMTPEEATKALVNSWTAE